MTPSPWSPRRGEQVAGAHTSTSASPAKTKNDRPTPLRRPHRRAAIGAATIRLGRGGAGQQCMAASTRRLVCNLARRVATCSYVPRRPGAYLPVVVIGRSSMNTTLGAPRGRKTLAHVLTQCLGQVVTRFDPGATRRTPWAPARDARRQRRSPPPWQRLRGRRASSRFARTEAVSRTTDHVVLARLNRCTRPRPSPRDRR